MPAKRPEWTKPIRLSLIFWDSFEHNESNGCWEWNGRSGENGYGLMWSDKSIYAHRYSYIQEHGSVPAGKLVCHTCDNRKCVNPLHLYAGTYKTNAQDMTERNRRYQVEYNGETVKQAAKRLGTVPVTLLTRINKMGWSKERAFTEPIHFKCHK